MYRKSAIVFDAIYQFLDYSTASLEIHRAIQERRPQARTLLDVACGTGRHLQALREHYDVEGFDLSPTLLAAARKRCPGVRFHQGDMTKMRLGKTYDVVTCLFSAIGYVKTVPALVHTIQRLASHLNPGGVLVIEPWYTQAEYIPHKRATNVVRQPTQDIVWMYVSKAKGRVVTEDMHFTIATSRGIEQFVERHQLGLFDPQDYQRAFSRAGIAAVHIPDTLFGRGGIGRGMYVGVRTSTEPPSRPARTKRSGAAV